MFNPAFNYFIFHHKTMLLIIYFLLTPVFKTLLILILFFTTLTLLTRFETYSTELLVWIRGKIVEIRKRDFPNSLDGIQMYFKKFKVS